MGVWGHGLFFSSFSTWCRPQDPLSVAHLLFRSTERGSRRLKSAGATMYCEAQLEALPVSQVWYRWSNARGDQGSGEPCRSHMLGSFLQHEAPTRRAEELGVSKHDTGWSPHS